MIPGKSAAEPQSQYMLNLTTIRPETFKNVIHSGFNFVIKWIIAMYPLVLGPENLILYGMKGIQEVARPWIT